MADSVEVALPTVALRILYIRRRVPLRQVLHMHPCALTQASCISTLVAIVVMILCDVLFAFCGEGPVRP